MMILKAWGWIDDEFARDSLLHSVTHQPRNMRKEEESIFFQTQKLFISGIYLEILP